MTQKNDYARLCQELKTEVLDSWQEYTLVRLPIHDDPSRAALRLGPALLMDWKQPMFSQPSVPVAEKFTQ
jgi:hypothetical protein